MSAVQLYARAQPGFDSRVQHAAALLARAAQEHAGRIVQTTSLGAEDMVITDLIARHKLGITLATLDTGQLHAQTLALMARLEARYRLQVRRLQPEPAAAEHFVTLHGTLAMRHSVALRKACCQLRKLEPMQRLLAGQTAWVTGLRREQSSARGQVPFEETEAGGRNKLNPLADWSWADVWHYIAQFEVPYNLLHDGFFLSIGCAPCTRAIAVGEPFRAGRWWWEDEAAKECGLHVKEEPAVSMIGTRP